MDFIKEIGALALGSRLKRLVENLNKDVKAIFQAQQIDFEFFLMPIMHLLRQKEKLPITQIAEYLGVSQPAATQFCNTLLKKGLIKSNTSPNDRRQKEVSLSPDGERLLSSLQPFWEELANVVNEIMAKSEHNLMLALENFENQLSEKDFRTRVEENLAQKKILPIEIIDYQEELKEHFQSLNYEWLEKYFQVESSDINVLEHPQENILDKGGMIYFARINGEIVGTVSLLRVSPDVFEIGKIAVKESWQGQGIGKKLMEHCLMLAEKMKLDKLILLSNTYLVKAINLYIKMGFKVIPPQATPYKRVNIFMEKKM